MLNVIVAYCKSRGIGINNKIPWNLHHDMKKFNRLTTGDGNNAVIMGRKTWESLSKPLPNRINIVLSRTIDKFEGAIVKKSLFEARDCCNNSWIIGGSSLYKEAIFGELVSKVYVTELQNDFKCDTFFTKMPNNYKLISQSCAMQEKDIEFKYKLFKKV